MTTMTDPLPYFRLHDRVLYLGNDPPFLYMAPERELVARFLDEDRPDEGKIEDEHETIESTSTRVTAAETITTVTCTTIRIRRTPNVEAADIKDLTDLSAQPHPFGSITTVRSLEAPEARAELAAAQAVVDASDELNRALASWGDFCDAVTEGLADGASVDEVLKAAWPRRPERK